MTKYKEWPDATIDVLAGGTPCQSFSVAGLRKGLADPRGNLALTFLAIAERYRPRWIVWENVPGVYSATSHDAPDPSHLGDDVGKAGERKVVTDQYDADESHAFSCILAGFRELGYFGAYRTLDAQYCRAHDLPYAVPQRRKRVFFVGYLGDWRPPAAVLFNEEGLRGDPAPRRKAGKGIARDVARCLRGRGNSANLEDQETYIPEVSNALSARDYKMPRAEDNVGIISVAFDCKGTQVQTDTTGISPPLRAMGAADSHANGGGHAAVAFAQNQRGELRTSDVSPALNTGGGKPGEGYPAVAIQEAATRENVNSGPDGAGFSDSGAAYTLEARKTTQAVAFGAATEFAVRRLSPIECERLMGFRDNYTQIPWRGKPPEDCPVGPRLEALGNSWATNVAANIGRRIQLVEDMM